MSPRQKEFDFEFLQLQRRQLDARLRHDAPIGSIDVPAQGWVATIRTALGMTQRQLARRLGVSANSVSTLEKREAAGTVTIARLESAAYALDCDLRIAFVPRHGLQQAVQAQTARKAKEERDRIIHSMRLEAQDAGVERSLSEGVDTAAWLATRARELWD